ncbi:MAG: hypothetical protein LBB98_13635 [Treponema sp.]|nr:hypothetical protein [Treponema sp.]
MPIHPYFITSVDDDLDIRKLTVFLQTPNGEIVSKKVTYIIDSDKGISLPEAGSTGSAFSDESGFIGDSASTDESAFSDESGFIGDSASTDESAFSDDSVSVDGSASADDPVSVDGSASTDDSVSEDDFGFTGLWDETDEERGGNGSGAYRFFKRESIAEPSLQYEDAIYVKKLSGTLPPLLLPQDIEMGQYILVFQVLGEKGVLNRIEKPFYYIGTSEFTLSDIHAYLPGTFDKGHLAPPAIPIMLETKLAAGTNLNPYVVWYNGKKRIYEGYVADGAARFIWWVPARTGFHILKVEAFPFKPLDTGLRVPMGKIKELSLPVATKNESFSFSNIPDGLEIGFSEKELIPIRHYQLFANLEDSQSSVLTRNILTAINHTPEWLPQGNIFGLAVGPDHSFSIPGPLFTPSAPDAAGHLLFRFIPLADGTIFSGSFKLNASLNRKDSFESKEWFETVDMNLTYDGGMVSLNYSAGSVSGKKTTFLLFGQTENVVTTVISFEVRENTLRLSLGLNTPAEFLPDEGIPIPGPLTGEGTFRLGTSSKGAGTGKVNTSSVQTTAARNADPAVTTETAVPTVTAEITDLVSLTETTAAAWDAQTTPASATETNPPSPVIILDEIIFLTVPDISSNKEPQIIAEVSDSPAGIPEAVSIDILAEAISEGDTQIISGSGKTTDELEITDPSLPLNIVDRTDDASSLTE